MAKKEAPSSLLEELKAMPAQTRKRGFRNWYEKMQGTHPEKAAELEDIRRSYQAGELRQHSDTFIWEQCLAQYKDFGMKIQRNNFSLWLQGKCGY